jgi:hypothetical protein
MTFWETSSDGRAWTSQASVANPFGLGAVTLELAAESLVDNVVPPVRFDDLNIAP